MSRAVALTFDDGPDLVWTPRVLDELARARACATFFVIAPRAARHPGLIGAIAAGGHEVALHCHRHVRHRDAGRPAIERDTERALAKLRRLGVAPCRWRAPWGECAEWSADVARRHGLVLTGWTADTHDWRGDPAPRMLAAVADGLRPGAVVLMHDGLGPGARRAGCAETVRLIEPLAAAIRRAGCEPGGLPGEPERRAA